MKAKIKQINRYEVTIGDKTWSDFERVEEWEGMIKFSGPSGTLIVDKNTYNFNPIFNGLFGDGKEDTRAIDFIIIKGSDSLMPEET